MKPASWTFHVYINLDLDSFIEETSVVWQHNAPQQPVAVRRYYISVVYWSAVAHVRSMGQLTQLKTNPVMGHHRSLKDLLRSRKYPLFVAAMHKFEWFFCWQYNGGSTLTQDGLFVLTSKRLIYCGILVVKLNRQGIKLLPQRLVI